LGFAFIASSALRQAGTPGTPQLQAASRPHWIKIKNRAHHAFNR
jgi:hypothetical protein